MEGWERPAVLLVFLGGLLAFGIYSFGGLWDTATSIGR